jgi:hypothetical protein
MNIHVTLYKDPLDWPGKYVARIFTLFENCAVPHAFPLAVADTVDEILPLIPHGLVFIPRHPSDEPQIVGVWV